MKRTLYLFCSLVLFFCMFSNAYGHDYWLLPSTFKPSPGDIIDAGFTSAHEYFGMEETPDIIKYAMSLRTPNGQDLALAFSRVTPKAAWVRIPIFTPGTYVLSAVNTTPEYWTQTTKGWQSGPISDPAGVLKSTRYFKSIKTFFSAGSPTDAYKAVCGFEIEMVPQKNPTELRKGDKLPVQILFRGNPVSDVPVSAIYEGFKAKDHSDRPVQTKTNSEGIAEITLDRTGKWLVFGRHEFPTKDLPGKSFANYRPYILFEVH